MTDTPLAARSNHPHAIYGHLVAENHSKPLIYVFRTCCDEKNIRKTGREINGGLKMQHFHKRDEQYNFQATANKKQISLISFPASSR